MQSTAQSRDLGLQMLPTDAFFWYAEAATPRLRPLVAGLFLLDRAPDRDRFRAAIERLVARFPRLQQRVVEGPLPFSLPYWEPDAHFDLDYHLRQIVLPPPATDRHLLDFAGAMFATPLDHLRPLWEGYLIEGLEGGRAALFLKMHHSVMDGVGSLVLFDALTQAKRSDLVAALSRRHAPPPSPAPSAVQLAAAAANALQQVAAAAGRAIRFAAGDPWAVAVGVTQAVRAVSGVVADVVESPTDDPLAARCTGIGRRLDIVRVPLARLQQIKAAWGIPFNDLLLTAVTGAVRAYHLQRGIRPRELRAVVPVSLREQTERTAPGNHVGAFTVTLPLDEPDPLRRLDRIRRQTGAAKSGRRAAAYGALIQLVPLIPAALFRAAAERINGRVHLICSNVAGPTVERYLAGAKIEAVCPFAPILLGIPLSIALVSYGETCGIGIDTDPAAIPDPERLGRYLEAEIDALERRALPRRRPPRAAANKGRRPQTGSANGAERGIAGG